MPFSTISGGDSPCSFLDNYNSLVAAVQALESSGKVIPTGLALDWYGDPEDADLWDSNGIGVANSQMDGWAQCNGQDLAALSITSTIKNPDGTGSVITILPDPTGTFAVARKSSDADFANVGNKAGAKNHSITIEEMPRHAHALNIDDETNTGGVNIVGLGDGDNAFGDGTHKTKYTGGSGTTEAESDGDAFSILNPFFVWVKIIKYK